MRQLIVGLGEVGEPLLNILRRTFGEDFTRGFDIARPTGYEDLVPYDTLHICIPWSDKRIRPDSTITVK